MAIVFADPLSPLFKFQQALDSLRTNDWLQSGPGGGGGGAYPPINVFCKGDDVVIIAGGRVRAAGPLSSLLSQIHSSMRVRTPEADRLLGVLAAAHWVCRRLAHDLVVVEGVTPDQLGPVLARSQIVVYELVNESTDLESVFLSLTGPQTPSTPGVAGP